MSVPGGAPPNNYGYPQRSPVSLDVIGEAWTLFSRDMGTWIVAQLVCGAIGFGGYLAMLAIIFGSTALLGGGRGNNISTGSGILFGLVLFITYVLYILALLFVSAGLHRLATKQIRGQPISIADLFSVTDCFVKFLILSILMGFAVLIGELFFIIPGLIFAGLFMLAPMLLIDGGLSPIEAMKKSWEALKSDWLMATVVYFVLVIVASLGAAACGVGLLFTMPLLYLGTAIIYRDVFNINQQQYPYAESPGTTIEMPFAGPPPGY